MVTHYLTTLARLSFSILLLLLINTSDVSAQSHNKTPGARCRFGKNPNTEGEACLACDAEEKKRMALEQEERYRKATAERERKDREAAARKAERDKQYNSSKTEKLHLSNSSDSHSGSSGSGTRNSTTGAGSSGSYNNNSSGGLTNPLAPGGSSNSDLSRAIDRGAQMQNQNTQQRSWTYEEAKARHEEKSREIEAREKEKKAKENALSSTEAKISYYEGEAKKEDTASMYQAGLAYFSRAVMKRKGSELGVDDMEKAAYWFARAADKGHIEAAFQAGNVLSIFFEKEKAALAVEKLEQAAWAGHIKAMDLLYKMNLEKTYKYKNRNKDTAVAWLERAAFAGDASSMYYLAQGYERGSFINTSYRSFKNYNRACTLYCIVSQLDYREARLAGQYVDYLRKTENATIDEDYFRQVVTLLKKHLNLKQELKPCR
jgi:TPR repeat protein